MTSHVPITIRPLEAGDRARWAALLTAHGRTYGRNLNAATLNAVWSWLVDDQTPLRALVADHAADGVVGIVHYQFAYRALAGCMACQLSDLHVERAWRGHGIGRRLIEGVRAAARDNGCAVVRWLGRESNHAARRLYDSLDARTDFVQYELAITDEAPRRNRPPARRGRRRA